MSELASRNCVPCRGGVPPLAPDAQRQLAAELDHGWQIVADHHLERVWRFADFRSALAFTNAVGALAEAQGHHPDFELGWGRVQLRLWTHAIDGLTESDFVFAAKVDRLDPAT